MKPMRSRIRPIGWARTRSGLLRPIYPVAGGGDWPAGVEGHRIAAYTPGASSSPPALTAGTPAHTKGAYATLIASTPFDAEGIFFNPGGGGANLKLLLDLAIGAAGSEQVIVPDILWHTGASDTGGSAWIYIPIAIPAGTRLAARCQSQTAGAQVTAGIYVVGAGWLQGAPLGVVDAYGVDAAATNGTRIDPGATANTKGAYTQIVASTTRHYRYLLVGIGYRLATLAADQNWLLDVAIGAAAAEQVIIPDLFWRGTAVTDSFPGPQVYGPFPVDIPAGTRLAARAQSSNNTAGQREFDVALYGIG